MRVRVIPWLIVVACTPFAHAGVEVEARATVEVEAPVPALPLWILDLAGLPLLPTAQSVLDGLTWRACSTPQPDVAEVCSLPVPLGTPVPVDLDRARGGAIGLVQSPDFTAQLLLAAGDAASAAALLDPAQIDAIGDGVALRFEVTRSGLDALDGTRASHGRIYARLHIPAVNYDAVLGFDSPVSLADNALATLGIRGEDIPAATQGRFATDFVLTHTPAEDHALLVGLSPVERAGLFDRAAHDPLALSLRFSDAPSRLDGTLLAEQTPEFEGIAVTYALPDDERPALELLARQDFTRPDRLQPDVATRHLRAHLPRMPGAARVTVGHVNQTVGDRARDRVDVTVMTSEPAPAVSVSESLELSAGGLDRLDLVLTDVPALDCGAACTTVSAFLPRALAEGRFDPKVTADFGVDPADARLEMHLATARPARPAARLFASARDLPVTLTLDADVDLPAQDGVVRWSANRAGVSLDRLQIETDALNADLQAADIPRAVDLALDPRRLGLATAGAIGRLRGWLTTTDTHPALLPGAHLIGGLAVGDVAEVSLALDLPEIGGLMATADCAPGYLCADLRAPGGAAEPIVLDLDARVDDTEVQVQGTLTGLAPRTRLQMTPDEITLDVDAHIGAALILAIGEGASLAGLQVPESGRINATITPTLIRAGLALKALPLHLTLGLAGVRDIRGLGDPANMFRDSGVTAVGLRGAVWRSPLADAPPLATLRGMPAIELDVDVRLLAANGEEDVRVRGALAAVSPIDRLVVGPLGVNGVGAETRGLEAHVHRDGGVLQINSLEVAIRKRAGDARRDVLRAAIPNLPADFALFTVIGGHEINLPESASVDYNGLALLLDHDGGLPALEIEYRDDDLPLLAEPDGWHLRANLLDVPDRVWLVASGGRANESTSGCIGIDIPTPSLEYVASRGGLGLDLAMQGSLLTPNLQATFIGASIGRLPTRVSINALNSGAKLLQIKGFSDAKGRNPAFIEDLDIELDAALALRLDCGVSRSASPFSLSGRVRLGDARSTAVGAGRIGLGVDGVRDLTLDFGDVWGLFGLMRLSVDWSGLYLDLSRFTLSVDLPVHGEVSACAGGSVGEISKKVCADFGASIRLRGALSLEAHHFSRRRDTTIASRDFEVCTAKVKIEVGRVDSAEDADLTMVYPRGLFGSKALAVLAAMYLALRDGTGVRDLLDFGCD